MNKVELLAPAGDLERLKFSFLYGADACYIGGLDYSLRANAQNFSLDQIKEACLFAHKLNKKVYVTVNIIFHNEDTKNLEEYLKNLEICGVDAIIISDLFVAKLASEVAPNLKIHISTQTSTLNYEAVNFLKKLNVERVVLGREASREEIKEIIDKTKIEVECFIHGAMCASYSGRCVLSNYFTNRDANRGGCAQICRWCFPLYDTNDNEVLSDTKFTMSTKDLSMITNIKDMIDIGIASLKVEGRMRSNYYVATVINTYRNAIDDYYKNNLTDEKIKYYQKILNRCANRDNKEQFYNSFPTEQEQYYLGRNEVSNQDFLGIVIDYNEYNSEVTLSQRNYFKKGDVVEIFGPSIEPFTFTIPDIYDEEGNILEVANHPEQIIKFKIPKKVYQYDIMRIKL